MRREFNGENNNLNIAPILLFLKKKMKPVCSFMEVEDISDKFLSTLHILTNLYVPF